MRAGRVFFFDPALGAAGGHHATVAANYRRLLHGARAVRFVGHVGAEVEHPLFRHRLDDAFRVSRYGVAWVGDRRLARLAQWGAGLRNGARALPAAEGLGRARSRLSAADYCALFSGLGAGEALDAFFASAAPGRDDDVVCLGVDPAVLAALVARRALFQGGPRLHLLFMYPEEDFVTAATCEAYWALAREAASFSAHVFAEFEAHAAQLRSALGCAVSVQMTPVRLAPLPPPPNEPFVVTALGAGRGDKAFDRLPAVAAETEARDAAVRFQIQAPARHAGLRAPLKALERMRNVQMLPAELTDEAYERALTEARVVLLAYDQARYRTRGSGVLVDALIGGRPAIVTKGTALAEAASPDAMLTGADAPSFAEAIVAMRADYARFADAAAKGAACALRTLKDGPLLQALRGA